MVKVMKAVIQKYKYDAYIENIVMFTARAVATLLCFAAIIVAFVIIGTVLGELVWVVIPART